MKNHTTQTPFVGNRATADAAVNAALLANGQPFPSLGSRDKPVQNADGGTGL